MDKKKVTQLAEFFNRSCQKLIKDRQVTKAIASPANIVVTLAVIHLFSEPGIKARWG